MTKLNHLMDHKLINGHLNRMHNELKGLKEAIDSIEGNASRNAALEDYRKLVGLFESLDNFLG